MCFVFIYFFCIFLFKFSQIRPLSCALFSFISYTFYFLYLNSRKLGLRPMLYFIYVFCLSYFFIWILANQALVICFIFIYFLCILFSLFKFSQIRPSSCALFLFISSALYIHAIYIIVFFFLVYLSICTLVYYSNTPFYLTVDYERRVMRLISPCIILCVQNRHLWIWPWVVPIMWLRSI